jgi:hypothetical protein
MRLIPRRGPRKPKLPYRRLTTPTRNGTFRPTLQALEARDVPSTLVVTNIGDTGVSGDGSLRGEIATAHSGDTINFNNSLAGKTITLDPTKGPLHVTTNLTILGLGADQITVSGGKATGVFTIDPGATDTLAQLTIANGLVFPASLYGGGIFNGGTLTVDQCTLSSNYAQGAGGGIYNGGTLTVDQSTLSGNSGGGIWNLGTLTVDQSNLSGNSGSGIDNIFGTVTVDHSVLSDNSAGIGGGGIYNDGGTLTVGYSTIAGNSDQGTEVAEGGGGIFNQSGMVTVDHSTLSDNSVSADSTEGGGIVNFGTLTVDYSTVSGNSTGYGFADGGGIFNGGTLTVNNSALSGNSATIGGGIFNSGTLTVTSCTLSDNSALTGGGISSFGTLTVNSCILSDNSSVFDGGGISNGGTLTVEQSTLAGNSAGYGGGIYNFAGENVASVTIDHSTLAGNSARYDGGGIYSSATVYYYYSSANLAVDQSTLAGNSAGRDGGGIFNSGGAIVVFNTVTVEALTPGTATVEESTLSGNSAVEGGGIFNNGITETLVQVGNENVPIEALTSGTVTVDQSTLSNNSTSVAGGGVWNGGQITIQNESAVFGNQAPAGADLENSTASGESPTLSISHSAVRTLDDQNTGATTVTVAATDTATMLTSSLNPSLPGQEVFNLQVLAAGAGAPTPTGTVGLFDGTNTLRGSATLAGGVASFTVPLDVASHGPVYAVYTGSGSFLGSGSTSAPVVQAVVAARTTDELQAAINSLASSSAGAGVAVTLAPNAFDSGSAQAVADAIAQITAPAGTRVAITFNAPQNTYGDLSLSTQTDVSLVVNFANGTQVVGNSPALVVTGGDVTVTNATFTTATNAPTILVTGGSLTLRDAVVQESTGYADAAISVTGGAADLGSTSSPGDNTINVNGSGTLVQGSSSGVVSAAGDTFQSNGTTVNPFTSTTFTSSASQAFFGQSVTLTATVAALTPNTGTPTGTVSFFDQTSGTALATVALSGGVAAWTSSSLTPGGHTIIAVYSGNAKFISSSSSLVENVSSFSGFLAPLSNNLAFNMNRVIPIKWQLGDSTGNAITGLGAVVSLQVAPVLTGGGLGTPFNPTASNGIGLRNDGKTYTFNWDTKGVAVGTYQIQLTLADGTVQTKTLQIVTKGGYAALVIDGASGTATSGGLLAGDVELYVDNSDGELTPDELASVQDAVTAVDTVTEPYGVKVEEVSDPAAADVKLSMNTTSAVGGYADGVLGCTTDAGQITIIAGWNFYAGSDTTQIGAGQYDFQTVVTHELGHALGLGHSADITSVMYASLNTGTVSRSLTATDLNVPDADGTGACGLHAAVPLSRTAVGNPAGLTTSVPGDSVETALNPYDTNPQGIAVPAASGAQQSIVPRGATAGGADTRHTGRRTGDGDVGLVLTDWLTSAAVKKSKSTSYTDWLTDG